MSDFTTRWDTATLNKFIGMIFKKSQNITMMNLRNMQRLINSSNFTPYQTKSVIMKRVGFIKKALYAKLDEGFEDDDIIINYCRSDTPDPVLDEIIINIPKYRLLNHREIKFLNKMIEDRLEFGIVQTKIDEMTDIIQQVTDGDYSTYSQVNDMILEWINSYNAAVREVKSSYSDNMIDMNDERIVDKVRDVIARIGASSNNIITGIQMFNEMLSPGFRPGKLYMFLGLPGGFKSAMLLKVVLDTIKFNKQYRPKQDGMRPCVLYITLENTMEESFARAYNMTVRADDMESHTAEEVVKDMKEAGIVQNDYMDGIIMYKPNMSITTQDIRGYIDDLASQGREVVLISVDYIKRIRPQKRGKDEKEELKNVTNELRNIAVDYFIPVISAQQLNRTGIATVNAAMRNNEADLARFLGADNVGSAIEVYENADMLMILNLERRKTDGRLFLTIFRVKERYRPYTKLNYFNQPFEEDNELKLINDVLMDKPQGVISLATDMEGVDAEMVFDTKPKKHNRYPSQDKDLVTDDVFDLTPLTA